MIFVIVFDEFLDYDFRKVTWSRSIMIDHVYTAWSWLIIRIQLGLELGGMLAEAPMLADVISSNV